jgi:hypothetical protein
MEMALHRQLKEQFGPAVGGQSEVSLAGFRIDAIDAQGSLVEVQSGALGPLRGKLAKLLLEHRLKVVKPVVISRRILRKERRDGATLSARMSPKRGELLDVFEDLMGLVRLFPHPNLQIDVMEVGIDEVRIPRRRWPGYRVVDRTLREEGRTLTLHLADDLWKLLPAPLPDRFTTVDLAETTGRSVEFAQKIAYCLRSSGAATAVGKTVNRIVYQRMI